MDKGKVTIKYVEDITRDNRCNGHESPICREAVDTKDLRYKRGVNAEEKTVAHYAHIYSHQHRPTTDQTTEKKDNKLTAGQGRNKDEHMWILNASTTYLGDAINYTWGQQTPEATHMELLNDNVGPDT